MVGYEELGYNKRLGYNKSPVIASSSAPNS